MKKIILFAFCTCLASATLYGQNTDTYQIEKLEKAKEPLNMNAPAYLFRNLKGKGFVKFSHSDPLVGNEMHPVISGYLQAYQEHRPITLSPVLCGCLFARALRSMLITTQKSCGINLSILRDKKH